MHKMYRRLLFMPFSLLFLTIIKSASAEERLPTSLPNLPCKPIACPLLNCPKGTTRFANTKDCKCPSCESSPSPESAPQNHSLVEVALLLPCKPIVCIPVKCPEGTTKVTKNCRCPICVPVSSENQSDPSSESARLPVLPPACKPCGTQVECGEGTRLRIDPRKCKSPRCIAIPKNPLTESARLPVLPSVCDPPADRNIQCGKGTKLVTELKRCSCPKCVPIDDEPSTEALLCKSLACHKVFCPGGTKKVSRGCTCPSCVPINEELVIAPPQPVSLCTDVPLGCPQVLCAEGTTLITNPKTCCQTCICIQPKFCPALACPGTWRFPLCGCPICVPQ